MLAIAEHTFNIELTLSRSIMEDIQGSPLNAHAVEQALTNDRRGISLVGQIDRNCGRLMLLQRRDRRLSVDLHLKIVLRQHWGLLVGLRGSHLYQRQNSSKAGCK